MKMIDYLVRIEMKLVLVFDGDQLPSKKGTQLDRRQYAPNFSNLRIEYGPES